MTANTEQTSLNFNAMPSLNTSLFSGKSQISSVPALTYFPTYAFYIQKKFLINYQHATGLPFQRMLIGIYMVSYVKHINVKEEIN